MDSIYLLVLLLFGILSVILLFNYIFYKYYVDPIDNFSLATVTVVLSMSMALLCVLLIPIDVFLTSYKEDTFEKLAEIIRVDRVYFEQIMLFVYGISLLIAFGMIPFAYFYGDERIDDIQPSSSEFKDKICNSIKYTVFFLSFCGMLIIFGLFFKQGESGFKEMKESGKFKWVQNLFDTEHKGEQAISFVMSIFSVFGMLFLILYTGYGLGCLPLYLIKGKKSLTTAHKECEMDKAQIRERIRSLQEKMTRKGALANKEKRELAKLREDEQQIEKRITKISNLLESENVINTILNFLSPFRVIIGIIFLTTSILILFSLLTTSLDRLLHSKCGLHCGYVLDDLNYTNYIDYLLLQTSKYFHLDYILFAFINIYVFICSIYGFVKLGVKFFIFNWFEVSKQSTNPQGLLVMSFMKCLMTLAFMMEMLTLAPQYSTFGTQTFNLSSQQKGVSCNLSLISGLQDRECVMSNISKFYNRISISLPFFSTIFYIANWLLIIILALSIIYATFFREEDPIGDMTYDGDEERGMLSEDISSYPFN